MYGPRIPYTPRPKKKPGRRSIPIRVCSELVQALRLHPKYRPYCQGYSSGDAGTARILLYELLNIPLDNHDDERRNEGPRKRKQGKKSPG